jgi:hypothetical protein
MARKLLHLVLGEGAGVIWNGDPLKPAVIPAKANPVRRKYISKSLRSRFPPFGKLRASFSRERLGLANDTNTRKSFWSPHAASLGAFEKRLKHVFGGSWEDS